MDAYLDVMLVLLMVSLAIPLLFLAAMGYGALRLRVSRWAEERPMPTELEKPGPTRPGPLDLLAGPCVRCGKERHEDGSKVTWRCHTCGGFVCRGCTLTMPGSVPTEYYGLTLCSQECWEGAGGPED